MAFERWDDGLAAGALLKFCLNMVDSKHVYIDHVRCSDGVKENVAGAWNRASKFLQVCYYEGDLLNPLSQRQRAPAVKN